MCNVKNKILTLLFFAYSVIAPAYAQIFKEEVFKTHLRWNFKVQKSDLVIKKAPNKIVFQTLDLKVFEKVKKELSSFKLPKTYFRGIKSSTDGFPERAASIEVNLANKDIEFFTFYKNNDNKIIVDFWKNKIIEEEKSISVLEKQQKKKRAQKKLAKAKKSRNKKILKTIKNLKGKKVTSKLTKDLFKFKPYRDFRYGLSLIWDYRPIVPSLEKKINLKSKTAEYFYPINDRKYQEDEKEAHMQLTINLYRKKKWGLMKKSMDLYKQKYGLDKNDEFNQFMKINSLLVKYRKKQEEGTFKNAVNMLESLANATSDYDLRKGIYQYCIQFYIEKNNRLKVLELAKNLFVHTRENYDVELSEYALSIIFDNLAKLGQWAKIQEISSEKGINKIISSSKMLAYKIFLLVNKSKHDEAIDIFKSNEKSLEAGGMPPTIYFNIAEAYFREAKYKQSIKYFDKFLKKYSYFKESPKARLRIALMYDLTSNDMSKVVELYKNSLNRSPVAEIRYEAKLRYLGAAYLRKRKHTSADKDLIAFLNYDETEKTAIEKNKKLQEALWLVRLRTMIVGKRYKDALSYLRAIPVESMEPTKRRTFLGDGAEIVYGYLLENYRKENYSEAVRLWEAYKEDYQTKVAVDPVVNFVICKSYLNLGLGKLFSKTLTNLRKMSSSPKRTFPVWITREEGLNPKGLLVELSVLEKIATKEYDQALNRIESYKGDKKNFSKYLLYKGYVQFKLKNYKAAKSNLENFLVKTDVKKLLKEDEVANLFQAYTESLYQLGDMDKFIEASEAILIDVRKKAEQLPKMKRLAERVNYLMIEVLAGKNEEVINLQLENRISRFLKEYEKTLYKSRVQYLLGRVYVMNKKDDKGEKILNEILNDESAPNYLKELAKSELSSIKIKKLTI